MSTTTTTEEQEVREILALANKLRPAEREKLAWVILRTLHPGLRPEMFKTTAELVEYITAKPDAVIGNRCYNPPPEVS